VSPLAASDEKSWGIAGIFGFAIDDSGEHGGISVGLSELSEQAALLWPKYAKSFIPEAFHPIVGQWRRPGGARRAKLF
jgi:hypothetical protein